MLRRVHVPIVVKYRSEGLAVKGRWADEGSGRLPFWDILQPQYTTLCNFTWI